MTFISAPSLNKRFRCSGVRTSSARMPVPRAPPVPAVVLLDLARPGVPERFGEPGGAAALPPPPGVAPRSAAGGFGLLEVVGGGGVRGGSVFGFDSVEL